MSIWEFYERYKGVNCIIFIVDERGSIIYGYIIVVIEYRIWNKGRKKIELRENVYL